MRIGQCWVKTGADMSDLVWSERGEHQAQAAAVCIVSLHTEKC